MAMVWIVMVTMANGNGNDDDNGKHNNDGGDDIEAIVRVILVVVVVAADHHYHPRKFMVVFHPLETVYTVLIFLYFAAIVMNILHSALFACIDFRFIDKRTLLCVYKRTYTS